jgi:hypothetical protein
VDRILRSLEAQRKHYTAHAVDAARVLKESRGSGEAARSQPERAAWTLVANALLNLDETVTK